MTTVFVYGSLMGGFWNNKLLEEQEYLGIAKTRAEFNLYSLGSFPGVVDGTTVVIGEVYNVDERCLASLDNLEGYDRDYPERSFYTRRLITLADRQKAWIYVFNRAGKDKELIASGDWRKWIDERGRHRYA